MKIGSTVVLSKKGLKMKRPLRLKSGDILDRRFIKAGVLLSYDHRWFKGMTSEFYPGRDVVTVLWNGRYKCQHSRYEIKYLQRHTHERDNTGRSGEF